MPRKYRLLFIIVIVFVILIFKRLNQKEIQPTGNYFGQAVPDLLPQVFAPGFISRQFNERDAAYTPNGQEFYFVGRRIWSHRFLPSSGTRLEPARGGVLFRKV